MNKRAGQRVRSDFVCNTTAIVDARRFAAAASPPEHAADVALLVSELASNAIEHARTTFSVAVDVSPDTMRVSVTDGDPHVPVARAADTSHTTGRGLGIVDAVASRWGVSGRSDGKDVWFELDH